MEEDRISDLPDNVLEHILSLLTLKEAVRTSLLSKRWRRMNVCCALPNLNFIDYFYYGYDEQNKNGRKRNRRLLNVVDKILLARSRSNLSIQKLSLELLWIDTGMRMTYLQFKVERWMKCLPKAGLTTLDFHIGSYGDRYYDFPLSTLAAAHSLQNLFLSRFRLISLSSPDIVEFSSLRSLRLWNVVLDDDVMQKLLVGSPLLEILELECIDGLKSLQVRGFRHLKMLAINCGDDTKEVHIDAANLEVLELCLPEDMITMATCAPNLRQFELKGGPFFEFHTKLELKGLQLPIDTWLSEFLSQCFLLEQLTLVSCPSLHSFHLSTPLLALKKLYLHEPEDMTSLKIVAPNLEEFFISVTRSLPFVELNASDKLQVVVKFHHWIQYDGLWHDRLAKFLGCFNNSAAIKLSPFYSNRLAIIPKEMRNKLSSPLYSTKYLKFSVKRVSQDTMLFSEYMDYMLWLSPRATNLTIKVNGTEIVLEFLYEEKASTSTAVVSSSCPHCMLLLPLKCWQHHLKEVKIQEFVGDEARKVDIKRFLWEEIENLSITEKSFDPGSIYGGLYASYDQLFK